MFSLFIFTFHLCLSPISNLPTAISSQLIYFTDTFIHSFAHSFNKCCSAYSGSGLCKYQIRKMEGHHPASGCWSPREETAYQQCCRVSFIITQCPDRAWGDHQGEYQAVSVGHGAQGSAVHHLETALPLLDLTADLGWWEYIHRVNSLCSRDC